MNRAKFDEASRVALTDCVQQIEATSDAEVVLMVRARSGSYRHADYLCGAALAFVGLLLLLFLPLDFHEYWVPIDVVLLFSGGAFLSSRSNLLRRLLTSKTFRSQAVRQGAAAMFYEAGIANTSAEMGLLIYLSILERRLELIADRGILKGVNALEWNELVFELHQAGRKPEPQSLQDGLQKLGALLAKHLPASGENPNELPDAPRFELK
jgi:putative membrane protein